MWKAQVFEFTLRSKYKLSSSFQMYMYIFPFFYLFTFSILFFLPRFTLSGMRRVSEVKENICVANIHHFPHILQTCYDSIRIGFSIRALCQLLCLTRWNLDRNLLSCSWSSDFQKLLFFLSRNLFIYLRKCLLCVISFSFGKRKSDPWLTHNIRFVPKFNDEWKF